MSIYLGKLLEITGESFTVKRNGRAEALSFPQILYLQFIIAKLQEFINGKHSRPYSGTVSPQITDMNIRSILFFQIIHPADLIFQLLFASGQIRAHGTPNDNFPAKYAV